MEYDLYKEIHGITQELSELEGCNQLATSMFINHIKEDIKFLTLSINNCQSPIEEMLVYPLMNSLDVLGASVPKVTKVCMSPQVAVKPNGENYILDFGIAVYLDHKEDFLMFAVECDGHDFHEKTKEQARKDKQRERDIMSMGCTVIRFTGSEIYKDPYKCASEVRKIILAKIGG